MPEQGFYIRKITKIKGEYHFDVDHPSGCSLWFKRPAGKVSLDKLKKAVLRNAEDRVSSGDRCATCTHRPEVRQHTLF